MTHPSNESQTAPLAGPPSDGEPFGEIHLGWNAVYLRRSNNGLVLIDAGPDYPGSWVEFRNQLAARGVAPESVTDVLITHAHVDHAGHAARWRALGARVWIGAADSAALAAGDGGRAGIRVAARAFLRSQGVPLETLPKRAWPGDHEDAGDTSEMKDVGSKLRGTARGGPAGPDSLSLAGEGQGEGETRAPDTRPSVDASPVARAAFPAPNLSPGPFPAREGEDMGRQPDLARARNLGWSPRRATPGLRSGIYRHTQHWPGPLRLEPSGVDGILSEGMRIAGVEVLACAGHTPGSCAFYDRDAGLLYTGDHLLPGITPPPGLIFEGDRRIPTFPLWLAGLARLAALSEARVMPAHGDPFAGMGGVVARNLAHAEQRARRLRRLLLEGPATAYSLVLHLFPHLPEGLLWFKLAEVIGLLDLLLERGLATQLPGEPVQFAPA